MVFSYLYIDDLAKLISHFIDNDGKHKFYNATPNETADLLSIAQKVNELSGSNHEIIVRNSGLGPEYSGDNSRLRSEIPNFKSTSMGEGISRLYKWYSEHKAEIDKSKLIADKY